MPQATFLSLTKEGRRPSLPVWPWVVTDTGFQLLTKTTGWASGHPASQWPAIFPASVLSRYGYHPRQAGVVSNFPMEAMEQTAP